MNLRSYENTILNQTNRINNALSFHKVKGQIKNRNTNPNKIINDKKTQLSIENRFFTVSTSENLQFARFSQGDWSH